MRTFSSVAGAGAVLALAIAGQVSAYEAGDWIVRAGLADVQPRESSSDVTLGSASLGSDSGVGLDHGMALGVSATYMLSSKWGIEVLAATPFKHEVSARGSVLSSLGIDKVADIKHLPPTVSLQYYFADEKSVVQPYVGLGINYTTFFDEQASSDVESVLGNTSVSLDDSVGVAAQIGLDAAIDEHWGINVAMWWVDIDTEATLKTAAGKVKTDVDVDPFVYMVGVSYRF